MQQSSFDSIIISDSSCLIALGHLDRLGLLENLYSRVAITPEIKSECRFPLPDWVDVKPVKDMELVKKINKHLDIGESTAIALANESKNSLLIIDEDKGRKYALSMGLLITGTLGVLRQAYENGFIGTREEAISLINELKKDKHFRISDKIIEAVKSQMMPRCI